MKKNLAMLLLCLLCFTALSASAAEAPPELPSGQEGQPPQGEPPAGQPGEGGPGQGTPPGEGLEAPPDKPEGSPGGDGFGGSGVVTQGTAVTTIDSDSAVDGESYASTGDNENALRIVGAIAALYNIDISKSGATANTEDSDFYGQNAGLLATDAAQVEISGASVNTSAEGGNAIFSYGGGTTLRIVDSVLRTTGDHSGGVHVAGGGTLAAVNLDVETEGASSAPIRSDRGGGTLSVEGGVYTSKGSGSPAIYSAAEIIVSDATLTAQSSEAIVVEGKNSVTLTDCHVQGNMSADFLSDVKDTTHAVMIYQSMSGDADVGQSAFSMTGGSLTSLSGEMFYITNTSCTVSLRGVALTQDNDQLLRIAGNNGERGWGSAGANGGQCQFTAIEQALQGVITVDAISSLELSLEQGSVFQGAINPDGEDGTARVSLDDESAWILTADSHISAFEGDLESVMAGEYHLYIAGELAL